MFQSYDIGSLCFPGDISKYLKGAESLEAGSNNEFGEYFEKNLVNVFLDKLKVGIDVPNFPQFRDMSLMFLSMIAGLEKAKDGYVEIGRLELKPDRGCLPEVFALKKHAQEVSDKYGSPFSTKICVTGPYTLASFFPYRTSDTFDRFGKVLSAIVDRNIFHEKAGSVVIVSVDEPLFGLVNDALIDHGAAGRESLFRAWEKIFRAAKSKNVRTCLHLHNTSDGLFWGIRDLEIVESHMDDPLYQLAGTKKLLESSDKFLKASVCALDFDWLIKRSLDTRFRQTLRDSVLNQQVADVWQKIRKGSVQPEEFLESADVMRRRASEIVGLFGENRVPFVGPECGLGGFPTYATGLECLRRVASATRSLNA